MPFLWDGDVALVAPRVGREVDVGDVICYETPPERLFLSISPFLPRLLLLALRLRRGWRALVRG